MTDQDPLSTEEARRIDLRAMLDHHEQLARQIAELATGADTLRVRMSSIEAELKANTDITSEVRDLLQTARSGMRVLGWLGTAAGWLGRLAAAAVAMWGLFYALTHNGELPPHK